MKCELDVEGWVKIQHLGSGMCNIQAKSKASSKSRWACLCLSREPLGRPHKSVKEIKYYWVTWWMCYSRQSGLYIIWAMRSIGVSNLRIDTSQTSPFQLSHAIESVYKGNLCTVSWSKGWGHICQRQTLWEFLLPYLQRPAVMEWISHYNFS
jgi:hypothetical protein